MMPMGAEHVARVVQGRLLSPAGMRTGDLPLVTDATSDSRTVRPGTLFVAIRGEHVDGHDFLSAAHKQGAVLAIVEHEMPDAVLPQIVVDNSVAALGKLARENIMMRRQLEEPFTVVALTGSVGKTTTKDLLGHLLGSMGETIAPVGSFNNEIGLPLTALRVGESTRFLVAEMGANHLGEIASLTRIVPPDIALVLKVGVAHLGEFGSVDHIAQAKTELVRGMVPGGTAVLNADDEHVRAMAALADGQVDWFGVEHTQGLTPCLDARDIEVDEDGRASFTLADDDGARTQVHLGIAGRHNVMNALAASAVARRLGMPLDRIGEMLGSITSISPHRMAIAVMDEPYGSFTMIDDTFNANPDSMRAAIDSLTAWHAGERGLTRVAVLGGMLELGDDEAALHHQVGAYAAEHGVDIVLAVASDSDSHLSMLAADLADGAADTEVVMARSADEALTAIESIVRAHPASVMLFKGSHASGLSALTDTLALGQVDRRN